MDAARRAAIRDAEQQTEAALESLFDEIKAKKNTPQEKEAVETAYERVKRELEELRARRAGFVKETIAPPEPAGESDSEEEEAAPVVAEAEASSQPGVAEEAPPQEEFDYKFYYGGFKQAHSSVFMPGEQRSYIRESEKRFYLLHPGRGTGGNVMMTGGDIPVSKIKLDAVFPENRVIFLTEIFLKQGQILVFPAWNDAFLCADDRNDFRRSRLRAALRVASQLCVQLFHEGQYDAITRKSSMSHLYRRSDYIGPHPEIVAGYCALLSRPDLPAGLVKHIRLSLHYTGNIAKTRTGGHTHWIRRDWGEWKDTEFVFTSFHPLLIAWTEALLAENKIPFADQNHIQKFLAVLRRAHATITERPDYFTSAISSLLGPLPDYVQEIARQPPPSAPEAYTEELSDDGSPWWAFIPQKNAKDAKWR